MCSLVNYHEMLCNGAMFLLISCLEMFSFCSQYFCQSCDNLLSLYSPSGCTFWGQRTWSARRRWTIRIILWTVAPAIILLISMLAFPVITVAIPVATGYEVCNV